MNKIKNKRLIAKIDFKGNNLIKGIQFDGLRSLGKVNDFAKIYYDEGIDEIIFNDCVASLYHQEPKFDLIKSFVKDLFIPITISGGIHHLDHVKQMFDLGADKVAINTAAVNDPKLIYDAARIFGSQSIISSIDIYREVFNANEEDEFFKINLYTHNGKNKSFKDYKKHIKEVINLGAGELLLNSINRDGTGDGCDYKLINLIKDFIEIPLIYSGGVGSINDVTDLFKKTNVDAIAAASIFHYNYYKKFKRQKQLSLRLNSNQDYGNYDFYHDGYGNLEFYNIEKLSVKKLKKNFI